MKRRRVRPEDLDTLFGFHREAYRPYVEAIWGPWDDAWQRANFAEECAQSTCEVFAEGDGLIGYVQFVEEPHQLRLWNIVICPPRRGARIGSVVLEELQHRARERGVPLTLRLFPSNEGAYRFYSRLGFHELSRSVEAIEMIWR